MKDHDSGMVRDGAEARARAAYQDALEELHTLATPAARVPFRLANPHRRWSADERLLMARYAAAWARLVAARAELETLLARG